MRLESTARSVLFALLAASFGTGTLADVFDMNTPDSRKGALDVEYHLAYQRGLPVNADPLRFSTAAIVKYGVSDWWKLGIGVAFDQAIGEDLQFTTVGTENTFVLRKLEHGFGFGWFTAVEAAVHRDETNSVLFGPLLQFGSEKASITLNPFLEKTFGQNREEGVAFVYAWQARREIRENLSIGIEGYGTIPDLGHAPGIDFQEHRLGPVLYLDFDLDRGSAPKRIGAKAGQANMTAGEDQAAAPKLAIEVGVLFGLTEATADTTLRFKAVASF